MCSKYKQPYEVFVHYSLTPPYLRNCRVSIGTIPNSQDESQGDIERNQVMKNAKFCEVKRLGTNKNHPIFKHK